MPSLPESLELCGSTVTEISECSGRVILHFSPARLISGTSISTESLELSIGAATVFTGPAQFPARIEEGRLTGEWGTQHNQLRLPLSFDGEAILSLQFESGCFVMIHGRGIQINFLGDRRALATA